jgi:hypothetical protein
MERQGAVENQSAVQGFVNTEAGLQARLTVDDRAAAEPKVRDLVSRADGRVVSHLGDGDATVLVVSVPADRWDALRVTGQKVESAGRLLITLRLGR